MAIRSGIEVSALLKHLDKMKSPVSAKLILLINNKHVVLTYPKFKFLYSPLERDNYYFFIYSGSGRVFFKTDGNEITTQLFSSGSILLSGLSFENETYIQALTPLTAIKFLAKDVQRWCERDLGISRLFREIIQDEVKSININSVIPKILPVYNRYNYFLTHHANKYADIPLKYIASYLGIRPETISRLRNVQIIQKYI